MERDNKISALKGLATGIGSLPHKDAGEALDLVFKYTPQVPFWPQLPKRDIREGMVSQFSEGLPCIKIKPEGLSFNPDDKEKELERFYDRIIKQDIDYFKVRADFAQGLYAFHQRLSESDLRKVRFIKCHISGPFTFGAGINDEKGVALLHDPVFMQTIVNGLTMKAIWQIKFFQPFGKKIILFLDEPYLGCFGSAYTPVNRQDVIKVLTEITGNILKSADALLGVHCCGNTDWSIFTEIKTIDIISFDAFSFLERLVLYAEELKKFLQAGGVICWGIVPTQEYSGKETAEFLADRIDAGIKVLAKKGIGADLLLENLMLSPSCGLGTLDIEKSDKIFGLLSETAKAILKKFI